jgi:hypothetical protein
MEGADECLTPLPFCAATVSLNFSTFLCISFLTPRIMMRYRKILLLGQLLLAAIAAESQVLHVPVQRADALAGHAFAESVISLSREAREDKVYLQVTSGNVPNFLRHLVSVTVSATAGGTRHTLTYHVLPDYLAIGSEEDYVLMPMTPVCAQRIADTTRCILPTRKMVDDIYRAATVKLSPKPIPPTPAMTTIGVFIDHNDSVWQQRIAVLNVSPLGVLVGGDKKDVIISNAIYDHLKPAVPRPVVIYGWHQLNGGPIQPLYNGHDATYADYSHGIRLIQKSATLDGLPVDLTEILKDSTLSLLICDEGIIAIPRYRVGAQ